jgi:hypothetical protein
MFVGTLRLCHKRTKCAAAKEPSNLPILPGLTACDRSQKIISHSAMGELNSALTFFQMLRRR